MTDELWKKVTEKNPSLFADSFFLLVPPPVPRPRFPPLQRDHFLHTKAPAWAEQATSWSSSSPGNPNLGVVHPCPCRWEPQPTNSLAQKLNCKDIAIYFSSPQPTTVFSVTFTSIAPSLSISHRQDIPAGRIVPPFCWEQSPQNTWGQTHYSYLHWIRAQTM